MDLYAIGNALVDLEYPVEDAFLVSQDLRKGTMQLGDVTRQLALKAALDSYTSCAGKVSGGSAANTAYTLACLGGTAGYACRLGDDELGRFYLADLNAAGVQVGDYAIAAGHTGTCLVMVSPDAERTMHTELGASSELAVQQVDPQLGQAQWFYIEGYLATSDTARDAVKQARAFIRQQSRQPIKIALSLSDPAMVQFAREGLMDLIGDGVDALFCNEMEARLFTDQSDLTAAQDALHQFADLVVVTCGAQGALVSQRNNPVVLPIPPQTALQVLDTNGAGDGYAGAFLYGLSQNFTLSDCGFLASAVASRVVAQYGPRLPRADYSQIMQQFLSR